MAPPKKWEEESEEESSDESVDARPVVAARRKFGDEEDSDDVADNWDEEEDSEVEREKAKAAAAAKAKAEAEAAKNKKPKSQRIEEHREEARRRRAAEDEEEEDSDEDEADRRARLRKNEIDADLKHAQDLLGAVDVHPRARGGAAAAGKPIVVEDTKNPGQTIDLSSIPLFKPSTKTEFEALAETLVPLLRASSSRPHYALWIPGFVKSICQDLPSTEIKKVASQVTALSNEKLKDEKAQDKTGKKSKAAKTKTTLAAGRDMGRGMADVTSYDDDGLDDGEFM